MRGCLYTPTKYTLHKPCPRSLMLRYRVAMSQYSLMKGQGLTQRVNITPPFFVMSAPHQAKCFSRPGIMCLPVCTYI